MRVGPSPARAVVRLLGDAVHLQHIGPVDGDAGEAVALRPGRDLAAADLLVERNADRVAVVLADEDDRQLVNAGEVHGLVDLTLVAGALAEAGERHDVVSLDPGAHRDARPHGGPACPTGDESDTML